MINPFFFLLLFFFCPFTPRKSPSSVLPLHTILVLHRTASLLAASSHCQPVHNKLGRKSFLPTYLWRQPNPQYSTIHLTFFALINDDIHLVTCNDSRPTNSTPQYFWHFFVCSYQRRHSCIRTVQTKVNIISIQSTMPVLMYSFTHISILYIHISIHTIHLYIHISVLR